MGHRGAPRGTAGQAAGQELSLPLVTIVDTPGAELSRHAEESGLAGEIPRSIALMSSLSVPTIAAVTGQGCGGGAIAATLAEEIGIRTRISPVLSATV